jgi:hypothetical protein
MATPERLSSSASLGQAVAIATCGWILLGGNSTKEDTATLVRRVSDQQVDVMVFAIHLDQSHFKVRAYLGEYSPKTGHGLAIETRDSRIWLRRPNVRALRKHSVCRAITLALCP